MVVFLCCDDAEEVIFLRAPVSSEEGTVRGSITRYVHRGEDFHGYSYEVLRRLGHGRHELTFPPPQETETPARAAPAQ